jgi:hypothetical protein
VVAPPVEHRRARRAPAAQRVPALPVRRVAVLRRRDQHLCRVRPLLRALARGRRPRAPEEEGRREDGVSASETFTTWYLRVGEIKTLSVVVL